MINIKRYNLARLQDDGSGRYSIIFCAEIGENNNKNLRSNLGLGPDLLPLTGYFIGKEYYLGLFSISLGPIV